MNDICRLAPAFKEIDLTNKLTMKRLKLEEYTYQFFVEHRTLELFGF